MVEGLNLLIAKKMHLKKRKKNIELSGVAVVWESAIAVFVLCFTSRFTINFDSFSVFVPKQSLMTQFY